MIRAYNFSIATNMIHSEWSENVVLEFPDDMTESDIEREVSEMYTEWLFSVNQGGWSVVKEVEE